MSTFLTIILVALTVTVVIGLITFFSAQWFSHIAVRPGRAGNDGVSAGLRPELVAAKSWAKDGAWKKAIQIAEAELAKEPSHYGAPRARPSETPPERPQTGRLAALCRVAATGFSSGTGF